MKKLLAILFISSILSLNSCGELLKLTTLQEAKVFVGSIKGYKDGIGEQAQFNSIYTDAIDKDGNIYIGDCETNSIRKVSPDGKVTTFLKSKEKSSIDGKFETATFDCPRDLVIDENDSLYFKDLDRFRKISNNNEIGTILKEDEITPSKEFKYLYILYSNSSDNLFFYSFQRIGVPTLYFYKLASNNKILETIVLPPYKSLYGKEIQILAFNKEKKDVYLTFFYFDYKDPMPVAGIDFSKKTTNLDKENSTHSSNIEIYKFNLESKSFTKISVTSNEVDFFSKENMYDNFVVDKNNYIYKIVKNKVVKFSFDLKYKKELTLINIPEKYNYRKFFKLVLDEKRKLLYIFENSDYKRIYKVNIE